MFFIEGKETYEDTKMLFQRAMCESKKTLKKKEDPEKFMIQCCIQDYNFSYTLCDTGSVVSIKANNTAGLLELKVKPSEDSFTFVDNSKENSVA